MGRVFCRKLERSTAGVGSPYHTIRLSREIKADLRMWLLFLRSFNAELLWPCSPAPNSQLQLYTDAAGSSGFGAFFQGDWCAGRWPQDWLDRGLVTNMLLLELFPITVAAEFWASRLANHSIVFWCDNLGYYAVCSLIFALPLSTCLGWRMG